MAVRGASDHPRGRQKCATKVEKQRLSRVTVIRAGIRRFTALGLKLPNWTPSRRSGTLIFSMNVNEFGLETEQSHKTDIFLVSRENPRPNALF